MKVAFSKPIRLAGDRPSLAKTMQEIQELRDRLSKLERESAPANIARMRLGVGDEH
jgi:hypothetical protein